MKNSAYLPIITFSVLAFLFSYTLNKVPFPSPSGIDLRDIACGFGPLLSGHLCYLLFKTPTTYSVDGKQPLLAWGIVLTATLTFVLTSTGQPLIASLRYAGLQLLYCFGEEFGWRHYLQSATRQLNSWLQAFVIGTVWFIWHYSWLDNPVKAMLGQSANAPLPIMLLITVVVLSLFSAFAGQIMRRTNALLLPVLLHFSIKTNSATLAVSVVLIVLAMMNWDKLSARFQKGR